MEKEKTAKSERTAQTEALGQGGEKGEKDAFQNKTKGKRVRWGLWVFVGIVVGMVVCVGTVIGGIAALSAEADPDNEYLQKLASVPVLNLVIPAEKRGRAILQSYISAFEDGENRTTVRFSPFEYNVTTSALVDDLSYVSYLDLTATAGGKRQDKEFSLAPEICVDAGGVNALASAEFVYSGQKLYFKASQVPEALAGWLGLEFLEEEGWFSVGLEEALDGVHLDFLGGMELSSSQEDAAVGVILSLFDQKNAEYKGIEKVRGQNTYHFSYSFGKADAAKLLYDLSLAMDQKISGSSVADFSDVIFAWTQEVKVDLWFDDAFGTVKVAVAVSVEGGEAGVFGSIDVSLAVEVWNVGTTQKVEVPEVAQDLKRYLDTRYR